MSDSGPGGDRLLYWQDFHYSPESFLRWALDMGWKPGALPIGVIYTFQPAAARMAQSRPDLFVENTDLTVSNARMFMTCDDGPPVLVASLNPGGASMATQLEHLRFLGLETRYAAIVGTAGAMVEGFNFGDVVVVTSAVRADSISDRYLPPSPTVEGDTEFAEALRQATGTKHELATTWSVSVPYRQTEAELDQARSEGAQLVEMEAATLFAAAEALEMRATAALIVSDVSRVEGWESNWTDTAEPTNRAVLDTIETIRSLYDKPTDTA